MGTLRRAVDHTTYARARIWYMAHCIRQLLHVLTTTTDDEQIDDTAATVSQYLRTSAPPPILAN